MFKNACAVLQSLGYSMEHEADSITSTPNLGINSEVKNETNKKIKKEK